MEQLLRGLKARVIVTKLGREETPQELSRRDSLHGMRTFKHR